MSFGLVTIPVKLYSATEERDVTFRQVHPADGGRIKYKRVCEVCGEEIPHPGIAKGHQTADGPGAKPYVLLREALEAVVAAKLGETPAPEAAPAASGGDVVDLVAALKASVEAAKRRREAAAKAG